MSKLEPRDLERMRYHEGQMLRSRDFRDLATNESHLRWWHNRALHQPFGIAIGFGVEVSGEFIRVDPGVAYDAYGRELILAGEQQFQLPQHDETLLLLVRYATVDETCGQPAPVENCWPVQPTGTQNIEFVWRLERDTSYRDGVRVARIPARTTVALESLLGTSLPPSDSTAFHSDAKGLEYRGVMSESARDKQLALSTDRNFRRAIRDLFRRSQPDYHRRNARSLSQPRVASGTTIPDATSWTVWNLPSNLTSGSLLAAFEVQIDTSAIGFTEPPCYFAWLQGPVPDLYRELMAEDLLLELDTHVAEVSTLGFTFRLLARVRNPGETDVQRAQRFLRSTPRKKGLYISWLGIQSG